MAPPTYQDTTPLANQVAGHNNVLSDASGSLVIKPAVPREIAFYQLINSTHKRSPLAKLRPFLPKFYGTLRLEGKLDEGGNLNDEGVQSVPESVVLENIASPYTHPNIQDIKLGRTLHSPSAPPAKRLKMEIQARNTTTAETGIRLTGCQTWYSPLGRYILTAKSYGKGLKVGQLGEGVRRFFPMGGEEVEELVGGVGRTEGEKNVDEQTAGGEGSGLGLRVEEGVASGGTGASDQTSESSPSLAPPIRHPTTSTTESPLSPSDPPSSEEAKTTTTTSISSTDFTPPPTVGTTPHPIPTSKTYHKDHRIPPNQTLRLLLILEQKLLQLISVLESLEMRFIGASVLVVYEGDEGVLGEMFGRIDSSSAGVDGSGSGLLESISSRGGGDGGLASGSSSNPEPNDQIPFQEEEIYTNSDSNSDTDPDSESNSDSDDSDDSLNGPKKDLKKLSKLPPLQIKLIDFAHTRLTQGEGADEGVLFGLKGLVELVRGRRGEVEGVLEGLKGKGQGKGVEVRGEGVGIGEGGLV